jgi:hypothetical protein
VKLDQFSVVVAGIWVNYVHKQIQGNLGKAKKPGRIPGKPEWLATMNQFQKQRPGLFGLHKINTREAHFSHNHFSLILLGGHLSPQNSPPGSESYALLPSPTPIMSTTVFQPSQRTNLPCNSTGPSVALPTPEHSTADNKMANEEPRTTGGLKNPKRVRKDDKKTGRRQKLKLDSKNSGGIVATFERVISKELSKRKLSSDSEDGGKQSAKKRRRRFTRCQGQKKYMCGICSKPDCGECSNCL